MKPSLNISEESGLTVPEGYFEGLSGQIMARIRKEECAKELRELSHLLYSLQGENVFTVPRGYFEGLAQQIQDKVKPAAKVVSMHFGKRVIQYAAAAMVSGILATSGWWIVNHNQDEKGDMASIPAYIKASQQYKSEQQIEEGIDKIPDDAIIKYLESTGTDTDNEMLANNIQEQELPTQGDYLLNEKTLETYLKEIHTKTNN